MGAPGIDKEVAVCLKLACLAALQELVDTLASCRMLQCRSVAVIEYHDAEPRTDYVGARVRHS